MALMRMVARRQSARPNLQGEQGREGSELDQMPEGRRKPLSHGSAGGTDDHPPGEADSRPGLGRTLHQRAAHTLQAHDPAHPGTRALPRPTPQGVEGEGDCPGPPTAKALGAFSEPAVGPLSHPLPYTHKENGRRGKADKTSDNWRKTKQICAQLLGEE